MKLKDFLRKTIAVIFVSALLMSVGFSAFAVDDEVIDDPVIIDETDAPVQDETPYEEPETDAPIQDETPYEEPDTEPETEAPQEETDEYTEPQDEEESDEPEYTSPYETVDPIYNYDGETVATQAPDDDGDRVKSEKNIPTSISVTQGDDGDLTYGYISWACVIVGVIVVLIVLISNKTQYYGGEGKHRYAEGNRITGQQKRLLDEDYYRSQKYNSYYNKDIRR